MYRVITETTRLNLFFRLSLAVWGQNYATEMGQAVIAVGFNTLDQQQIFATVRPTNQPSICALERLSLRYVSDSVDDKGVILMYMLERAV